MVIAEYLERKYYGPRRRKQLAEAEARGRKEANAKFREWNTRRLNAEAKGEPFDDPPPLDDD